MRNKDNKFYVYEWYNKDDGNVFYVGKGNSDRWKNINSRNEYFKNYYNKYNCDVRKVKTNLKEEDAFKLEIELISNYRGIGQAQCNFADGGEHFGVRISDDSKSRSRFFGLVSAYNNAMDCRIASSLGMNECYKKQKYSMNDANIGVFEETCEKYGVVIGGSNIPTESIIKILNEYDLYSESYSTLNSLIYDLDGSMISGWDDIFGNY
jgi:hypothetical protein